jgi:MFS transporter, ACS family, pantothenate transporter
MFAWANDLTRHDDAKRAIVIASMNMFSIAIYMWWSIVFYNATQAPDWHSGNIAMICMGVFLMIVTLATYWLQRRQEGEEERETVVGDEELGKEEKEKVDEVAVETGRKGEV